MQLMYVHHYTLGLNTQPRNWSAGFSLPMAPAMEMARVLGVPVYMDGASSDSSAGADIVVFSNSGRVIEAQWFKILSANGAYAAEVFPPGQFSYIQTAHHFRWRCSRYRVEV